MIDTRFRAHDSLNKASSLVYAFFDDKLVTHDKSSEPLVLDDLRHFNCAEPLYVCQYKGQEYFTVELLEVPTGFDVVRLWDFLDDEAFLFDVAGRAMQLLSWNKTHQFCGVCSGKTVASTSDWSRNCSSCGQRFYPRLSPCVIMSIRKDNKILLAQRPGSKHSLYTVLAGFIEPGESAEQAVMREVLEEVGIEIKNIRYFSSQPWPFPGQLMLGYIADYSSGELNPDLTEVENTGWFDYQDLPVHPSPNTISGRLIRQTVEDIEADVAADLSAG